MDAAGRRACPDLLRPGWGEARAQRGAAARREAPELARPRSRDQERDPSQYRHSSHHRRDWNGLLRLLGCCEGTDLENLLLLGVGDPLVREGDEPQDQERVADDGQWSSHALLPSHGNESWKPPRVTTSSSPRCARIRVMPALVFAPS